MADLKFIGVNIGTVNVQRQASQTADALLINSIRPSGSTTGPLVVNPSAAVTGTDLVFNVQDGSSNARLQVTGAGQIAGTSALASPVYSFIGDLDTGLRQSAADTIHLTTGGTDRLSVSTTLVTSTLPIVLPVGAVGAPALYFTGDTTTGWYRSAANAWSFTISGTQRWVITGDAITSVRTSPIVNTSATNGSMFIRGNITTVAAGAAVLLQNGTGGATAFGNATAGIQALVRAAGTVNHTAATAGLGFTGLELNITQTSTTGLGAYKLFDFQLGGASQLVLTGGADAGRLRGIDGTVGSPSNSFINDIDTGSYLISDGVYGIATAGAERVRFTATNSQVTGNWLPEADNTRNLGSPAQRWANLYAVNITGAFSGTFADGAVGTPSITFTNDPNTGFWRPGNGITGVTGDGLEVVRFQAPTGANPQVLFASGSGVSAPSISFASETNTGFFLNGAGNLDAVVGGASRVRFTSADLQIIGGTSTIRTITANALFSLRGAATNGVTNPAITLDNVGSFTATGAGTQKLVRIAGTVNQVASTSGFTALEIDTTETSLGSGDQRLLDLKVGGVSRAWFNGRTFDGGTSGDQAVLNIDATVTQTGFEVFTGINVNVTETTTGIFSGYLIGRNGGSANFFISSQGVVMTPDGSGAAPTYAFASSPETGMYSDGGEIAFAMAGGGRIKIAADGSIVPYGSGLSWLGDDTAGATHGIGKPFARAYVERYFAAADGDNANPAFTFENEPGTGMYLTGSDLTFTVLSSKIVTMSDNDAAVLPGANATYDLGSTLARWNNIYGTRVFSGDGLVGSPSFAFADDTNTGLYRGIPDSISFATGGTNIATLYNNQLYLVDGSASAPAYTFLTDGDVGLFRPSSNILGFAVGGSEVSRWRHLLTAAIGTETLFQFQGTVNWPGGQGPHVYRGISLNVTETAVGASGNYLLWLETTSPVPTTVPRFFVDNLGNTWTSHQFIAPDGSGTDPSFVFTTDTDTGFYSQSPNVIGVTCGTVATLQISRGATSGDIGFFNFGSATSPNIGWTGDVSTGIYNPADNSVGFTCGGRAAAYFVNTGAVAEASRLFMQDGNPTATTAASANSLYEKNIIKCWGKLTTTGAGAVTINDGFNITSATISGNNILLTINTDLANANYSVVCTAADGVNDVAVVTSEAVGSFQIAMFDGDAGTQFTLGTSVKSVSFILVGQQ
jgi:hypothetical protein